MTTELTTEKNETFEQDLARLASIVEEVENSQTPLDTALDLFKEGLKIADKCGGTLQKYESDVLTLQKNADNTFSLNPIPENSGNNGD